MDLPEDYSLPSKYSRIELEALNPSCRRQLALHLNLEGTLNDELNIINNFLGLAEKIGFSYLEIRNFEMKSSPTEQLLADWTSRSDLSPTVGNLWQYLQELERYDVLTDVWKYIKKDCDRYIEIKSRFATKQDPIQDTTVSQSTPTDHDVDESLHMAVDDVLHGTRTMYDAFVCYNPEGSDLEFVRKMIEILEDKNGLKLFVPWRDDLPGASHNTVCAKLIEQRCKRMIIVLSPQYLQSQACDFQTKFAFALAPGSRNKKLIPVLIEECDIPEILRHVTCCNYTKKDLLEWFWKRLISSLKAPLDPSECQSTRDLRTVSLDTSIEVPGWSDSSSSASSSITASSSSSSSNFTSSSSGTRSGSTRSDADYLQLQPSYPPYLELLSNSPPLPRKSNDYERISNVRQAIENNQAGSNGTALKQNHVYTQPIAVNPSNVRSTNQNNTLGHDSRTPLKISPAIQKRPVPPIPKEDALKQRGQSDKTAKDKEVFC